MARTLALALTLLVLTVGEAQATEFRVVVAPELDLAAYAEKGAIGLLVPGAGPRTSEAMARAALVRGKVENSLRGDYPEGPPLVGLDHASTDEAAPTIFVALPQGGEQQNDRRYPIAVVGDGYTGLLTSDSTRIAGLVSIADVAPTALGTPDGLGYEPEVDALAELGALDRTIDEHNDARLPATLLAAALVVVLALVFPPAAVPGFAAALAANLALGLAGASSLGIVLAVTALAVLAGGAAGAFALRSPPALGAALAAVVLAYLLVLGLDGPSVALSPFGPTQNARFYGVSNLLETLLLLPALAGAALLGSRLGPPAFAAVALAAFVAVAGNRFGADGGGAIVVAAGFAVLAVLMSKPRGRALAVALSGAAVLALGLLALDAVTGASSHVTRALRGGPAGLAEDLADRVMLSYERITASWHAALLVGALAVVLALLVARTLRRGASLAEHAVPLALASAVAVSLVVNDSPNDVLLAGVTGYVAAERGMLAARWPGRSPFSSPSSRSL